HRHSVDRNQSLAAIIAVCIGGRPADALSRTCPGPRQRIYVASLSPRCPGTPAARRLGTDSVNRLEDCCCRLGNVSEPSCRFGVGEPRMGVDPSAFPATAAAALRNLSALSAQALAGIQERLAHRI